MRGRVRGGSLAIVVLIAVVGCSDDDPTSTRDGGADAGSTGGRGGTGGGDSGRTDADASGDGSGGTSDAAIDRGIDGSSDRDGGSDASPDREPALDVSVEPDSGPIVDSAFDHVDNADAGVLDAETGGPPPDDAGDALPADDADDAVANDVSGDADASASDALSGHDSDASLCDDGNPATFDFDHPTYGCGHEFDANPSDNDAWITYDVGFHVDVATGRGWALLAGSRNAPAAVTACLAHSVAGLGDWRIATIDDARSIAGGCAPTASGGSCPIDDPGCLATACGQASPACDACTGGQGPNSGAYCKVDVGVCTHFHTSSICTDCGDASVMDWIYGTSNGNFIPLSSLSGIPTACVSTVPGGVPPADGG